MYYGDGDDGLNWDERLTCNHHCVNTPGSYFCLCRPGYTLDADGHTCKGEFQLKGFFKCPRGIRAKLGLNFKVQLNFAKPRCRR